MIIVPISPPQVHDTYHKYLKKLLNYECMYGVDIVTAHPLQPQTITIHRVVPEIGI